MTIKINNDFNFISRVAYGVNKGANNASLDICCKELQMTIKQSIRVLIFASCFFLMPSVLIADDSNSNFKSMFRQALISSGTGHNEEAIKIYTDALHLYPQKFRSVLISRAGVYHKIGKDKEALADFDSLTARSTTAAEKHEALIVKYMEFQEYEKADQEIKILLKTSNGQSDESLGLIFATQAMVYQKLSQSDAALRSLNSAIKLRPNDPWLYYYRSETYTNLKMPKESAQDMEKFWKLSDIAGK